MKNKSLGLNAFLNELRSVLNIIFPIIAFPYVSRILSVGELGKYNWSNSYVSYFLLLAGGWVLQHMQLEKVLNLEVIERKLAILLVKYFRLILKLPTPKRTMKP